MVNNYTKCEQKITKGLSAQNRTPILIFMSAGQSRAIGKFLQEFFREEGIEAPDYPSLQIRRTSPAGSTDNVWTFKQLQDCYNITEAYHIEAENIVVDDESGKFKVDYVSVVLQRDGNNWDMPQVQTNTEEIFPGFDEEKTLERLGRFGKRAARAILAIAGAAESLKTA